MAKIGFRGAYLLSALITILGAPLFYANAAASNRSDSDAFEQQPGGQPGGSQVPQRNLPPDSTPTSSQGDTTSQMRDRLFIHEAQEGNMAEVKLGELAVQKSQNQDVRNFAQKMIDDHTQLMEKMKPLAEQAGVKQPDHLSKDGKSTYEKLNALSGDDFDHAYIKAMLDDHHKDLKKFQTQESLTSNADLKATVSEGEKVIAMHTSMIEKIADKYGVSKSK